MTLPPGFAGSSSALEARFRGVLWPALAGERGEYEIATGSAGSALVRLQAMQGGASGVGLIPEQVWEGPDLAASPFGSDPTTRRLSLAGVAPTPI